MPFNPIINSVGPALIEAGYSGAARAKMVGAAGMAQGISQAGQSLGQGIGSAIEGWQKQASQQSQNAGVLAAYHSLNEQAVATGGAPIIPQEYLDQVASEKNPDKISGSLAAMAPVFDSFVTQQRQIAVQNAAANASSKFEPTMKNVGGVDMMQTSPGQWQAMPKGKPEVGAQEIVLPDGSKVYKVGEKILNPTEIRAAELDLASKQGELREKDSARVQDINAAQSTLERINKFSGYVDIPGIVGPGADVRQMVEKIGDPETYAKRRELELMAKTSVLENLKNFKGQISNAEREFLEKMFPNITDPAPVWKGYLDSAKEVFERSKATAEGMGAVRANNSRAEGGASAAPPVYQSPDHVRAAYKQGRISRDEAVKAIAGLEGK